MFKGILVTVSILIVMLFSVGAFANTVHWTAKVKWATVKENDSAWVGLAKPSSPNPSTAVWNCTSDIVWLGIKDKPTLKSLLSVALTLYATKKNVRIGVRGSGDHCEAEYLSARE